MIICAKCQAEIRHGKLHVEDDQADLRFCDVQCWREWAVDDGESTVLDYYREMNVRSVIY